MLFLVCFIVQFVINYLFIWIVIFLSFSSHSQPGSYIQQPQKERKQSEEFHSVVLDVPHSFPELQKLSESQLERLLSDDVALKVYICIY